MIEVQVTALELEPNDRIVVGAQQQPMAAEVKAFGPIITPREESARSEMNIPCFDFAAIYDGPKVPLALSLPPA